MAPTYLHTVVAADAAFAAAAVAAVAATAAATAAAAIACQKVNAVQKRCHVSMRSQIPYMMRLRWPRCVRRTLFLFSTEY